MKFQDQRLLEEAYSNIKTKEVDVILNSLIAEDVKIIEQLIEEGFGDYLKKVGGAIKGGVQKAVSKIKETLTSGLASTLVKAIISAVPKEELENMVNIVAKGQVPKDKAEQVKGLIAQQEEGQQGQQVQQESYQERKAWFASMLFTEANIERALQNSGLLTEAKSGRELQKFAKEVANKINELYPKNKNAMAAAIPKFTDTVSKYLGLPPQSTQSQQASEPSQDQQQPVGTSQEQSQQPAGATNTQPSPGGIINQAKGAINKAVSAVEEKIPTGKGLVNKVMGFVKAHPKISAAAGAALLGIVVAAFAGSAPVVAPALIAAVKGAGIAGTTSIVKQMISGEKVDLKQAGKTAMIGGALGGVGSVLASGLGSIANAVMGVGGGGSVSTAASTTSTEPATSTSNKSQSWTSPDAHEYNQGEDMMQPYSQQQSAARVKEIANELGIDPNNIKYKLQGSVPVSINGQDVTKFLTPDEKEMANAAKQVAASMSR
jgi:hypothetical protein